MAWYISQDTLFQSDFPPGHAACTDIEWDSECITLPGYVTGVGKMGLARCEYARRILLPDSLVSLAERALWGCSLVEELTIPEGVREIGDEAFAWCTSLSRIRLPRSLKQLGSGAFKGCTALREIVLASDHPFLRFEGGLLTDRAGNLLCALPSLTEADIPGDVTSLSDWSLAGCSRLEHLHLPAGLRRIGSWAFSGCEKLSALSIPEGVREAGHWAFENCAALSDISLPEHLEVLGENPFHGCTTLRALALPGQFLERLDAELVKQLRFIRCLCAPDEIPARLKQIVCISYAEQESLYPPSARAFHLDLIRKNALRLRKAAFEHPPLLYLMCREKLIAARLVDAFMEEAEERGDIELTARLLEYQAVELTMPVVSQARERQERLRERQDDTVFERAAARMDKEGIAGLNFAACGRLTLFENRTALKRFIAARGARLLSSVSANADFLIVNNPDPETPAAAKALELGIEFLTEREFLLKAGEDVRAARR